MSYLKGVDTVMANLNKEIQAIEGRSMKGLIESANLIRYSMDKDEPKIPVDTDNLRGSWFANPMRLLSKMFVRMGFTANYAAYVHEMIGPTKTGKKINWNRTGSGPKFFEASIKRNKEKILKTIRDSARIK
jgi:hypothetical protein